MIEADFTGREDGDAMASGESPQPLRVLVVEDSENDFLLLISLLRRGGFVPEARRVDSEREFREALEETDWEIVIADYRLPEFSAPSALAIVKHYCPETPFIIVSSLMQEDLAAVSILSGAHDVLHKEKLVRLPAVIRRELKAARLRAAQHVAVATAEASRDALQDSEARFLLLTQHLPECFWLYDVAERKTVYVNEAYTKITGRPTAGFLQDPRDIVEAMHESDERRLAAALERTRFGGIDDDFRIKAWDGRLRWVHLRTFAVRDTQGVIRSVGGIMSDITDMVSQQHELQRMAHFDTLTGLPNRILFKERLSASLSMSRRNGWLLGLLLVDLDRFKVINDTLGHAVGDELLRLAAKRLHLVVRESDTVCRMGGDEFAIILPDLPSADDAACVSRKLIDAMAQPFLLAGQDLFVSASIGITLFPDDTDNVDVLISNADAAMYRAKGAGRNTYEFYRAEMNQRAHELLSLEIDLRQALARREYELHYQPKVSLQTGAMLGVEALIRWK
ncbi:MAG TPA: diguanylate cyclase, partial [Rhodocyclaceae bacterium]|nr:diguanylate cyclase [Rhodocyclaceae bacterium]